MSDLDAICAEDGCERPATHERLLEVYPVDCVGDGEPFTEVVELVCDRHQL